MKLVKESLLSDIKKEDIISKELINQLLNDDYISELFYYKYKEESIYDNEDSMEEVLESNDFKEWIKYEIEYLIDDTKNKLSTYIKNNKINIYRKIYVNNNWINNLNDVKRLGIYWSYKKDAAEPHWGYNNKEKPNLITLESEINQDYIDWIETIKMNMNPSYEEEKEIRLFKNTPLKITNIYLNDKSINIDNIKNKIFKA